MPDKSLMITSSFPRWSQRLELHWFEICLSLVSILVGFHITSNIIFHGEPTFTGQSSAFWGWICIVCLVVGGIFDIKGTLFPNLEHIKKSWWWIRFGNVQLFAGWMIYATLHILHLNIGTILGLCLSLSFFGRLILSFKIESYNDRLVSKLRDDQQQG